MFKAILTNPAKLFNLTGWRALGLAFLLGFTIRLIPELLSFPNPIGFDTVYYAWRIKQGVVWFHWSEAFSPLLLYALLVPVYDLVKGDPFLVLKLAAPLLFGLNTSGIYYFARKALDWTSRKSLFAVLFFSFQIAALSISWEFYRNLLGLGILLFALPFVKKGVKNKREFLFLALLSVLAVSSHEFASVILLVAALGTISIGFLKANRTSALKILGAIIPSFALLLGRVYLIVFPVSYATSGVTVFSAFQTSGHYTGVLQLFTNYLGVFDTVQSYSSYFTLLSHVFSLFALLFAIILPFVLIGFFRERVMDLWVGLLLCGALGLVIVPWFALDMWSRWMLMLVYPFTFYAVNGLGRVVQAKNPVANPRFSWVSWLNVSKRVAKGLLVFSFSFGLLFMACPLVSGSFGLAGLPTTVNYVPSTMQSNSLPLIDVDGAAKALQWVNSHMDSNTVFLAQDAFYWWSRLYLNESHAIVFLKSDFAGATRIASEKGFSKVLFVWWNQNIGWYGITIPDYFVQLRDFGRISVYSYSL